MRLVIVFLLIIGGFILLVVAVLAGALLIPATAAAVGVLAAIGVVVLGAAVLVDLLTPAPGACALVTRVLFRDRCGGTCPAGQICAPTATRPYGPFGIGGVQAAACACVPLVTLGGPGTPGGGTPPGSSENEGG
jgi:hypothetical protein